MSTASISFNVNQQQTESSYFQQRRSDLSQLSQDLQSGNVSAAEQDFNNIQSLAQTGPFGGDAFAVSARQQDFNAIGQALQSGNVSAAQQAFAQLESTFQHSGGTNPGGTNAAASTSANGAGPELILNLANAPAGEQITIDLNNTSNGNEQVTISATNPQNPSQNQEPVTLNLNLNSNEQVVLNLFNSASTPTSSTSGVSVNA